jgi:hypothetical protein
MATTTNLGIEKLNSSDYVSVDPINNAFDKIDNLAVDYVTEKGTSGEWWYRKWKSGRAECGIDRHNAGTLDHSTPWGSMYTSGSKGWGNNGQVINYPITFSAAPMVIITFLYSSSTTTHCSFVAQQSSKSTTTPPNFALIDPNTGKANDATFGIYVCGTVSS